MKTPLVSVILPIYNVEDYLERCINSILNQKYKNIEILAINDGSTDKSLEILRKFSRLDSRVKITNKKNGGQASARNLGIELAQGEYILMVDSDDYLEENTILECIKEIVNTRYDLLIFDFYRVNNKGIKKHIVTGTKLHTASTVPWNKFYRKSLWENLSFPEGYWYEDLGIVPVVVANSRYIKKIDKPLYNYDISRQDSQTNTINPKRITDLITMVINVYNQLKLNQKLLIYEKELESLFIEHILYNLVLKLIFVDDLNLKDQIINKVNKTLNLYFPNWKKSEFINKRGINGKVKWFIIDSYLNGKYQYAKYLWRYPKNIKNFFNKI
ncbi:glycosyltransferase family 2 protein [Terrilactibacillus laevilacticus]|uniref:Glycosyltransferase family 2 protein n=1 Tax=Terrilactibacillus laevilacticus TaxID=1380157 RepID=A0ABW5PLX0_9BACI|nr:glycosyltransferase family 2 protein [Terrilactibacillus laevilacticus]